MGLVEEELGGWTGGAPGGRSGGGSGGAWRGGGDIVVRWLSWGWRSWAMTFGGTVGGGGWRQIWWRGGGGCEFRWRDLGWRGWKAGLMGRDECGGDGGGGGIKRGQRRSRLRRLGPRPNMAAGRTTPSEWRRDGETGAQQRSRGERMRSMRSREGVRSTRSQEGGELNEEP